MPKRREGPTERLDALLVTRGLGRDLDHARRLIWSGAVLVEGHLCDQPAERCPVGAEIRLRGPHRRYATRGGEKLGPALARFGLAVQGRCVLDVGAAGGGFTDCLLSHGASKVYAVEVGRGQLAQKLRLNPRVVDMGGRDVLTVKREELQPSPTLAVVDVTFRSLSEVLPAVLDLLSGEREVVALLKPLQEAGALGLGRGDDVQSTVFALLLPQFARQGLRLRAIVPSRPPGPGGAREFFLYLGASGLEGAGLAQAVEAARAESADLLAQPSRPRRSGQQRRRNWLAFRRRRLGA